MSESSGLSMKLLPVFDLIQMPATVKDGGVEYHGFSMLSQQCALCTRRRPDDTCEAFPSGIPEIIAAGFVDHSEPYNGDGGMQFEPLVPGSPIRLVGGVVTVPDPAPLPERLLPRLDSRRSPRPRRVG